MVKKRVVSVLMCICLLYCLAQTVSAETTVTVPAGSTQFRIALACTTTNGDFAGAQFAIRYTSGLVFEGFEIEPSISASMTPSVMKDGKTYMGFFSGSNDLSPVDNTLILGYLVFEYSGSEPQSIEITELKLVRLIDSDNTDSEIFNETYSAVVERAAGAAGNGDETQTGSGPGSSVMQIGDIEVPLAEINVVYVPFIHGYPDGTVRPDGQLTRAELAQIVSNLYSAGGSGFLSSFSDVTDGHWAYSAISFCRETGFMIGYPDGSFQPERHITRAELCTTLARIGEIPPQSQHPFPDVGDHWAKESIAASFAAELIIGYPDGSFRPDNPVTRAEAVAMICRAEGRNADLFSTDIEFPDIDDSYWDYSYIMNAVNGYSTMP